VAEPAPVEILARPALDFTLTPPPMDLTRVTAEAEPEVAVDPESEPLPFDAPLPPVAIVEPEAPRATPANADLARRVVYKPEPFGARMFDAPFEGEPAEPMKFNLLPLAGLFLAGLASFAFAIVWWISAHSASSGLFGPMTVSWVAGLVGIGCIVTAIYLLTDKLGGSEE
jgi:hypothetical protein